MDAPVICQQIRETFTYPLMLRLLACKGFSREALPLSGPQGCRLTL